MIGLVAYLRNSDNKTLVSKANPHKLLIPPADSNDSNSLSRQPAQSAGPSAVSTDALLIFLQSKDPQASWNIQKHRDGRPSNILGGRIRLSSGSGALVSLLREISPHLGVRADDLRAQSEDDRTEVSNSSQMAQYYGKYRVYGALIKAFSNLNTQEVYHVVSDLRPIEDVDARISISRTEAGERAQKTFGNAEINVIKISQEPVVYGTTATNNQLVWRVLITSERPRYQSREILVSAQSGDIIHTQSLLKN